MDELAALPGLETVHQQLTGWIAVIRAELARREGGIAVGRPAWKNLVFTGGPGTGKSRAARAVARIYQELGLLTLGHVTEMAAADLTGTKLRETGMLTREAFNRAGGGILMITGAHAWPALPDGGQHVLRCLHRELTSSRDDGRDALAVILAGQASPLHGLLRASPALAARFPAVIDFPCYTAGQLAAIFATLAREAGFTLAPGAAAKAATVVAQAEGGDGSGNARLAVRLMDQATARQARRIMTSASPAPRLGRAEHDPGGRHPRAHLSARPVRRRRTARPVPVAAMPEGPGRDPPLALRRSAPVPAKATHEALACTRPSQGASSPLRARLVTS